MIYFVLVMVGFAFIEALWNVALFRPRHTWLPLCWNIEKYPDYAHVCYDGHYITDPFHIFKGAYSTLALSLIYYLWFGLNWYILLIWPIYYGFPGFFGLFYHELLMKKEYRDLHKQSWFWKQIYWWRK